MKLKTLWLLLVAAQSAHAATFTVTTASDGGAGSLRAAITSANATSAPDTIVFNINQAGVVVINLQWPLPTIGQPLILDGLSQSAGSGPPLIRLHGAGAGATDGLVLNAPLCTLAICVIRGLQITGFAQSGIVVQSPAWSLRGNYIGNDGSQTLANALDGIRVESNAAGVAVGGPASTDGNVISGNGNAGLRIQGAGTTVGSNLVGLNAAGSAALPNSIGITLDGSNTDVGGNSISGRNIISGNNNAGISITAAASNVLIRGNYIGMNSAGSAAVPNGTDGIHSAATASVDIGDVGQGEGNIIAGNTGNGIAFASTSANTRVRANRIGVSGATRIANGGAGIYLAGGGHTVGNGAVGGRNLISGNTDNGIVINASSTLLAVKGNYIGTSSTGTTAIDNGGGIRVLAANANVQIGGALAGEGNLIAGNQFYGIALDGGTQGVAVLGNLIGSNASGTGALPNQGAGITIGGQGHVIGSTGGGANLISGNAQDGIDLAGDASNISIYANVIGANLAGTGALANGGSGIRIIASGADLRIGNVGQGNQIAANGLRGIVLEDTSAGVSIRGNRIGTSADGNSALGNVEAGIVLNGNNHLIGGNQPGQGNQISGNNGSGISVNGGGGSGILGNRIGVNANGTAALANTGYGIRAFATGGLTIGSSIAGGGNLISGNQRGVIIENAASNVVLEGNIIGLDVTAMTPVPNGSASDAIDVRGSGAVIGGTQMNSGNIIAGNQASGISVRQAGANGTVILGNWIGTNPAFNPNLGNQLFGVLVDRADDVRISGNRIYNNGYTGVQVENGTRASVLDNQFGGNFPLDLDIADQGPEINDTLDLDLGANTRQNHPVIQSATLSGGVIQVQVSLDSAPAQNYSIEFFQAEDCAPSGLGGANASLGAETLKTDASGHAETAVSLPSASGVGVVTAIATYSQGSSSEFSPCYALTGANPGQFQIWRNPLLAYEGIPALQVVVVRSHGHQGAATVQLNTVDGSATSPADYTGVHTTLSFANGEVMRSVAIPIQIDAITEGQEQFQVQLSNPTGGATLGAQASVPAVLIENPVPFYAVSDASVAEPVSGTATMSFTVTLSPTSSPQSLAYHVEDASATFGLDYLNASGTLNFPASTQIQTRTVDITVLADTFSEATETFYLRVDPLGSLSVLDGTGMGSILPPGTPQPDLLLRNGFE